MKPTLVRFILSVLFVLTAISLPAAQRSRVGTPSAVELQGTETPEQIQAAYTKAIADLAPILAKSDGAPLRTFEATLHQAARPGAEAERAACCQAIAAALQGDAPAEAKAWMLKLVAFADRGEVVPTAAKMLDEQDPLLRESARYALQHIPVSEAAAALRAALARATDPKWQGALAIALGARKDELSVPTLVKLSAQPNAGVAEAAVAALGNIATPAAAKALSDLERQLLPGGPGLPESLRVPIAEAWMKCAEQMLRTGEPAEIAVAAAIYRALNHPPQPRSVRLAALQGTLKSSGDQAATLVLELLGGDDVDHRAMAAGFIPELDRAGLKKLAAGMGKLPPATQVIVLAALAERGEKSALPEALNAAKSADEPIRIAGLGALARLGDASTVPVLVSAMQAGGNTAAAARASLVRLDGAGVNEAVLSAMQGQTDTSRRAELIGIIEGRGFAAAVPTLLPEALGDNSNVRRAAMRALGRLATPLDLTGMLQSLLKSSPGAERDDAERAIASVCARVGEPSQQASTALALYDKSSAAEKAILLPVLGRLGGPKAFEAVKAALASSDPALIKAGEVALANWPDADDAVEAELISLAQRSQKPGEREGALRAYIRVISLPSGLPEKARLAKFQKAMDLASRDQERTLVLERVGDLKHIETLRFLVPCLEKPALANRAGNTICDLARERGLKERNKAEFEQALNKVIEVCKDPAVVERAKRRLAEK